ncbi:hypothetical protein CSUI_009528 [Cystoisospora suis]|uniref:Uncharacterized protein n=1 Tax=Cystoisospora suis TaxID=483139 RepID=A0A2C6KJJ6_9APIC|nr:hypothetical protein CSUI_009528 [Cystoisospora suis]
MCEVGFIRIPAEEEEEKEEEREKEEGPAIKSKRRSRVTNTASEAIELPPDVPLHKLQHFLSLLSSFSSSSSFISPPHDQRQPAVTAKGEEKDRQRGQGETNERKIQTTAGASSSSLPPACHPESRPSPVFLQTSFSLPKRKTEKMMKKHGGGEEEEEKEQNDGEEKDVPSSRQISSDRSPRPLFLSVSLLSTRGRKDEEDKRDEKEKEEEISSSLHEDKKSRFPSILFHSQTPPCPSSSSSGRPGTSVRSLAGETSLLSPSFSSSSSSFSSSSYHNSSSSSSYSHPREERERSCTAGVSRTAGVSPLRHAVAT